jgi:PAS domain S-box-containing protein
MNRKPTYEELLLKIKELENKVADYQYVEDELQKSKRMLKAILDSLPFDFFALDSNNRYFLQNPVCKQNWGDLIGKCPQDIPVTKKTLNLWMNNNLKAFSGEIVTDEVEYHTSKGKKFFYRNIIAPIIDEDRIYGILGVLVDISDRKQIEDSLKTSLKTKEILMSEIHHRVKNNFEIISSLLDLSCIHTEDQESQKLLSDIRSRIYSMALIHSQLYEDNRFDRVDVGSHVRMMLDYISHIYGSSENPLNFVVDAPEIYLSINQAIPLSLALNEIVTNSFKHAFKENNHRTISVFLNNPTEDTIFVRVKDDGVGISKDIDFNNELGVGLDLTKHLVEKQLNGEIRVNRDDGTEICVEFKKLKL